LGASAMPENVVPVRLTHSYHQKQHVRFTPDGQHLVWAQTIGARITLMRVAAAGGTEQPLLEGRDDYIQQHPAWSANGKQLAFTVSDGHRTGRIGIMVCAAEGLKFSNYRPVLFGGQFSYPSWSPDGKQLALIAGNQRLMVAGADG